MIINVINTYLFWHQNICCENSQGDGYIFKGGNSIKTSLLPSENGSTPKGKNLLPLGANSFLLE